MGRTFPGGGTATDNIDTKYTTNFTTRTWSAWFTRTGAGGANSGRIFQKQGTLVVDFIACDDISHTLTLESRWSVTNAFWNVTEPTPYGDWHHLVLTYDNSSSSNVPVFWVDGNSQSITGSQAPSGTANTDPASYLIGNNIAAGGRCWAGALAETAMWNIILKGGEVKSLYRRTSPLNIRRDHLVFYNQLLGAPTEIDLVTGKASPVTGTTVTSHPPGIAVPPRWKRRNVQAGVRQYQQYRHMMGMR
jgi:Concanavalin A-like lectin/glucanases superfamily